MISGKRVQRPAPSLDRINPHGDLISNRFARMHLFFTFRACRARSGGKNRNWQFYSRLRQCLAMCYCVSTAVISWLRLSHYLYIWFLYWSFLILWDRLHLRFICPAKTLLQWDIEKRHSWRKLNRPLKLRKFNQMRVRCYVPLTWSRALNLISLCIWMCWLSRFWHAFQCAAYLGLVGTDFMFTSVDRPCLCICVEQNYIRARSRRKESALLKPVVKDVDTIHFLGNDVRSLTLESVIFHYRRSLNHPPYLYAMPSISCSQARVAQNAEYKWT